MQLVPLQRQPQSDHLSVMSLNSWQILRGVLKKSPKFSVFKLLMWLVLQVAPLYEQTCITATQGTFVCNI